MELNKANECTCPSGDGSLVHPCPAHPAVEQAGTNVGHGHVFPRADGVKMRCGGPALCSECAADAYRARAALAQPSPTTDSRPAEWSSYDPTWVVDFIRDNSIFNADLIERMLEYATRPAGDVPQAEQAEAERPEGPTEDELEAAGLGYPLHKEEAVKLWYSGFRSEVITVLEAWEAIGHDIGMNPDKGELLDSLRYMLEKCEAHDAALAEVAGLRSLLNSLLCYVERDIDRMRSDRDKSDNKEIYDRSISLAMERLKAAQNAVFTTEPGCDTAVELAAQTTQAQHSVPEGWRIERSAERIVVMNLNNGAGYAAARNGESGIAESVLYLLAADLLAAAPGKEGV
ncbi:hypothetical protein [Pseudomonas aeruginosa]|uniref:hypothetical protein n=1 Tax=Pseudomonas aeruginosa TaxID=287 RepID=UPI002496E185|nr:hypothetical protein [Pseudomonas aeruginosa]MDI2409594.1 hypothetical protein [Pseudomonas aeruginosa]